LPRDRGGVAERIGKPAKARNSGSSRGQQGRFRGGPQKGHKREASWGSSGPRASWRDQIYRIV